MLKIDFKKEMKEFYTPSVHDFVVVEVPEMQFLMVDGHGDPNTAQSYQDALAVLYGVAYKIKFLSKKLSRDYVVPPLEGLWWAESMDFFTTHRDKDTWFWTMMIMQPPWVTQEMFRQAVKEIENKKVQASLQALLLIRLETYCEGLSVQIMQIGTYDDEAPALKRLHQVWLPDHGYVENGRHHEIYLSDPRRIAPEKVKTVLRQPIRKRDSTI